VTVDPADAYRSLAESVDHDDPRWAFGTDITGTGIEDVAAEIVAPVPDGVDPGDLAQYCLMLGDDALILAQRLAEWITNAHAGKRAHPLPVRAPDRSAYFRSNTMSSAPFHSTYSPSGRNWSTPSTMVKKWLPASWPTIDANIVPP